MPLLVLALHCGRGRYLKNRHIKAKPEILNLTGENTMLSFIFLNERDESFNVIIYIYIPQNIIIHDTIYFGKYIFLIKSTMGMNHL